VGDFNEELHPREEAGKFTDGGGSSLKEKMKAVSANPAAAFVAKHSEEAHAEPKAFTPAKGRGTPHVVEQHTPQGVVRHETNSKQEAHALGDKLSKQGHEVSVQPRDASKAQAEKPPSAKFAAPSAPAAPHQEDKPPPHTFGASPKESVPAQHDKPSAAAFPAPKGEPSEHQKSGEEKAFPAPKGETPAAKPTAEVTPEAKVAHVEDKFPYMKVNTPVHEASEHAAPAEHHEGTKPAEAKPVEAKPEAAPKEKKVGKSKGGGSKAPKESGGHEAKGGHGGGLGAWIQERAKGVAEGVKKLGEKANKFQEAAIKADPITMGFKAAGGAIEGVNDAAESAAKAIEKAHSGHGM